MTHSSPASSPSSSPVVVVTGANGFVGARTCRALVDHSPCPLLVVPPA